MDAASSLYDCAPPLDNEAQRLALLHSLELLDTPAEASFDALTALAAQVTGRPIALVGLVDADRTWFKSRVGLDAVQSPRDISFCGFAIAAPDVFVVPDAHADARFAANPLVTGAPFVRFYAGVPLRVAGLPMGTLCVVDHVAATLTPAQLDGLRHLGTLATELLERRLASRAKSEFIAHLNHEMRTPLNAILGFGQLLQADAEPASRQAQHLAHIVHAGQHLLGLIVESLDLMRLEAGVERLEMQPLDLVPLAGEVCELLTPMAADRRITLQRHLPARLPVAADPRRARQVLLNLISNAIKYGQEGGHVLLSGEADARAPAVTVADDGPGMTAEQVERLFRPFERLGREHGPVPGTGLGLALSARWVQTMGGRIDVASAPGRGSAFTVRWAPCDATH